MQKIAPPLLLAPSALAGMFATVPPLLPMSFLSFSMSEGRGTWVIRTASSPFASWECWPSVDKRGQRVVGAWSCRGFGVERGQSKVFNLSYGRSRARVVEAACEHLSWPEETDLCT